MSIGNPIRLKITQNGVTIGYVETLDLLSGISAVITGPVAKLTASGGTGGGDAATLGGHPPSYFGTAAQDAILIASIQALQASDLTMNVEIDALQAMVDVLYNTRSQMWSRYGVVIQATPPAVGVTYAEWLAGRPGNWCWVQIP